MFLQFLLQLDSCTYRERTGHRRVKNKYSICAIIPLPSLLKVLAEYKKTVDSRWMFSSPAKKGASVVPGYGQRRMQLILERVQCKKVRFHDLWHPYVKHTTKIFSLRLKFFQAQPVPDALRKTFLNDEHDLAYSNTVYEQYVQNIVEIEKGLVELRLQRDIASGKDKKLLKAKIKEAEESVEAMKIARKSMLKYKSSFETGLSVQQSNNGMQ